MKKKNIGPAYLPALKGRMGDWAFYTTLMKLSEVNERIWLSDEIYQNKGLSDMVQRLVKSERAKEISEYLKTENERFFPAMVVAVFDGEPNWLDFSIKRQSDAVGFDPSLLDRSKLDSFGFLSLSGKEKLFPLDGQHRLAGIREALADPATTESFLSDDEVTVMLVAHDTTKEGRTRSRRLFTVLNKRAVSVKKHETIALDEDDVMAIATRHLVEEFLPLSNKDVVSYRTTANISASDTSVFTTIVTIYDILSDLFRAVSKRTPNELRFNRPTDEWMEVYQACAVTFFSALIASFQDIDTCLSSNEPSESIAKNRSENGGHILFRPVGQRMFAQLVSDFCKKALQQGFEASDAKASDVKEVAIKAILEGVKTFSDVPTNLSAKPYTRLIWIPETGKMSVARASLVRDIILYKYDQLAPSVRKGMDSRLKRAMGDGAVIDDFLW